MRRTLCALVAVLVLAAVGCGSGEKGKNENLDKPIPSGKRF